MEHHEAYLRYLNHNPKVPLMNLLVSRVAYAPTVEFPLGVFTACVWPALAPIVSFVVPLR